MTHTQPVAKNFVSRNRIVAGCSDATIIVESAAKGGGLITCSMARSYNRDVFAFPGAVGAKYSEGCNNLIRDNGAALITSAYDFVNAMGWNDDVRLAGSPEERHTARLLPRPVGRRASHRRRSEGYQRPASEYARRPHRCPPDSSRQCSSRWNSKVS